jgi:hypothetical protein
MVAWVEYIMAEVEDSVDEDMTVVAVLDEEVEEETEAWVEDMVSGVDQYECSTQEEDVENIWIDLEGILGGEAGAEEEEEEEEAGALEMEEKVEEKVEEEVMVEAELDEDQHGGEWILLDINVSNDAVITLLHKMFIAMNKKYLN